MHGSFWVSAFRDIHVTTALIISCVFMQKQEKLVSQLNNNEFVHNNNKSLFLAKKTHKRAHWRICMNYVSILTHRCQSVWISISMTTIYKLYLMIWKYLFKGFDLNYWTPVYVNLFISLKWYIRCRAVLLPLELMSVSGNK